MRILSFRHIRARSQEAFWVIPAGFVVVAMLLALGLPQVDLHTHLAMIFPGGPESALSFLSSITTAMISITALVFSLTIVALQLAAGQFSSRVMRDFLRDRLIQVTFGVFVATFTYTMTVQRSVRGTSDSGTAFVPELAVSFAFLFVLVSVAAFIAYIDHIANAIRVANIVTRIGARTRTTLESRYPRSSTPSADHSELRGPPDRQVPCPGPGVLISVNEDAVVDAALTTDSIIVVVPRVGDFVPGGASLLTVYGAGPNDDQLLRHIGFDTERTYEQDVAFGLRELVDIAERALSPAVNDPTTAAQAIDVLHDLLRRLAARPTPTGWHNDGHRTPRLFVPIYNFADLLELAVEEIVHYGAHDVQTPRRLQIMLDDLRTVALPAHLPAIEHWSRVVLAAADPDYLAPSGERSTNPV